MRAIFVLAALSLSLVAVPSAQARLSSDAFLYQGGYVLIVEYRPRLWDVHGCDYEAGWVNTSPQRHKLIYVHGMDNYIIGVGRVRPNGRWAIWRREPFSDDPDVRVATVVRRNPTRWDILRYGRKVGWARGPDGPEAVTALYSFCR